MFGLFFMVVSLLSCLFTSSTGQTADNGVSEKILAFAGETVILPCHISVQHDNPTVEWSKEGLNPNIIFLYRDGCETFEMKHPLFKYRTNLNMNKLKNGDISLIISNVKLKDAGKYQCVTLMKKKPHVIKTLELVVGAVSEPKLRFVSGVGDGATLQCEANCWFPEPEITFLDDQGNSIRADNAKRSHDSMGCFNVTARVTVQTNRVTCRVHQPLYNKTRETETYIPAECLRSCKVEITITFLVTLFASTCVCVAILCKKLNCVKKNLSGQSSDQSRKCRNAEGVNHRACNCANGTDHLQKIKELEEKLDCRQTRIQQLTDELNDLRSRQGPDMQIGQHTVNNNPCGPSTDMSKTNNHPPHQLPHDNNPKPLDVTSNHNPKPGNSFENKDSEPGVLSENPALGLPVQTSSQHHNSPASLTNIAALSSTSSSASMSEENHLCRSKSLSLPHSNDAKIRRSNTLSGAHFKRFSRMQNLPEESEMLLTHEQE
ncbi:Butyrophilin subfamily 2 member A1 Precursor [Channa argus]|uniref:Butyrophilin subfamily 2 member A1 n=1 Tax=Channa argus TaxID=215402 RepID=A0A6G1Q4Y4_CHAAH|nr:Butyrophilin subfamily 2 member A1 Precursor [Channa argus]